MAIGGIKSEQAELVLRVTDKARKELAATEKSLRDLGKGTDVATKAGAQMETQMASMAKSLLGTLGVGLSLTAVVVGLRKAWEFAEAGIDDRRVSARFAAIAGSVENLEARLGSLKLAAENAMPETELKRQALLLDRIGIKLADSQSTVVGFARQYAKEAALPLDQALRQIQESLRTGEVGSLARFGIAIDDKRLLREYAEAEGVATESIARATRVALIKAAAVQEMGNRMLYATGEINRMESAASAWANTVSDMQRAWADFLDPTAAGRARGAGRGSLGLEGILSDIAGGDLDTAQARMNQAASTIRALLDQREALTQEVAQQRDIAPSAMGLDDWTTASDTLAKGLDQQIAVLDGRLDTMRQDLLDRRTQIQEGLGAITTALEGFAAKGAPLGQNFTQTFKDLQTGTESLRVMGELAGTIGWTQIAGDLGKLQTNAREAARQVQALIEQQAQVRTAGIGAFGQWTAELEKLTAMGSRATDADRERLVQLQSMTRYFGELNTEALKVTKALDGWVDTTAGTLAATKTMREFAESFKAAATVATTGTGDLAQALVRTEKALVAQRDALLAAGMSQTQVNLIWEAGGAKLDYLRQGLDEYLRSLENLPGVVAPTGLGLDPAELAKARAAAAKAFTATGGAGPEGANQELLTRARIARGEIQGEVAASLALTQAQLTDLQQANYNAARMEAERALIVKAGADQLNEIYQRRVDAAQAAMAAEAKALQEAYKATLDNGRLLQDERSKQLAAAGLQMAAADQLRQIERDLQDGSISAELAAERRRTLGLETEYAQRQTALQGYKQAFTDAAYSINDASWKIGQMQQGDEAIQEMTKKAALLSTIGGELAQSGFQIAAASQAQAAADREAAQERQNLTELQTAGLAASEEAKASAQTIKALQEASKTATASMGAGYAGALASVGGVLAVFAGGAREAAGILAAFSAAGAALALGFGAYPTAAQLGVAAAMFTAIALTSPSKKKSSAPEISSQGLSAPNQRGGDVVININMTEGVIYGDPAQIGENIIRAIAGGQYGNARIPKGVIA